MSVSGLLAAKKLSLELTLKNKKGERGILVVHEAEIEGVDGMENIEDVDEVENLVNKLSKVSLEPSFLDYMRGGCEINLCVAIDFTGSNGDPRDPRSLHHISDTIRNDYEKAIGAIGGVLSEFDTDKQFPG